MSRRDRVKQQPPQDNAHVATGCEKFPDAPLLKDVGPTQAMPMMAGMEARPEPPAYRKARLVTAYKALNDVRFNHGMDWQACETVLGGIAASIARLELDA